MATAYISNRFPTSYMPQDELNIRNGSLALANTAHRLAENQHWLVLGDQELVNFHTGGLWLATAKTVRVLVPPWGQYAAFHFFAARDFDTAVPTSDADNNGIVVSCATSTRYIANIEAGEDSSAKAATAAIYAWVHLDGIPTIVTVADQSALKLNSTPSETWTTVDVTVTLSPNVYCINAAYNILPNRAGYTVTV